MKTLVRLLLMLVLVAVLFGGAIGLRFLSSKTTEGFLDNMQLPPATISVAEAKAESWTRRIDAVGSLQAVQGVEVTAELEGIIKSIGFESGDKVSKGDVLVTLDADSARADLKTLQTEAALAQTNLKRLKRLFELESISRSDFDRAESEAAQTQARVQAQRVRVNQKVIRAPFSGELGIRKVNVGQYIKPGEPIVSLQSLERLYVDFKLPEQNVSLVQPGRTIKVSADLYPGEIYEGEVQALEPVVDEKTRNFRVRAVIDNPEGKLRPGVFARVELVLPGMNEVVIVPRTAINYNPYGNSVFVVSSTETSTEEADESAEPALVARQRFVKTGAARGDFVVIDSGLEPGEKVATSGLLKLRNDQPVKINNELSPDVSASPEPADT